MYVEASSITVNNSTLPSGGLYTSLQTAASIVSNNSTLPAETLYLGGGSKIIENNATVGTRTIWYDGASLRYGTIYGSNTPVWILYQLAGLANGAGGCTNANGCWSVNGGTAVAQAAAVTQDVVLFALPAKGYVDGMRIKTNVVCSGATTATAGLGTASTHAYYRDHTYDIAAAVSDTNKTDVLAATGSDTAAGVNVVASLVTTVENVDALADTCKVDYWVKWGVLP